MARNNKSSAAEVTVKLKVHASAPLLLREVLGTAELEDGDLEGWQP
jgi:hypothetical protein